jgi:hypothetical protein
MKEGEKLRGRLFKYPEHGYKELYNNDKLYFYRNNPNPYYLSLELDTAIVDKYGEEYNKAYIEWAMMYNEILTMNSSDQPSLIFETEYVGIDLVKSKKSKNKSKVNTLLEEAKSYTYIYVGREDMFRYRHRHIGGITREY